MEKSLKEAIGDYLLAGLATEDWSQSTHRQYTWHLDRWQQYLDDHWAIMRVDQVAERHLMAWRSVLKQRWADSTIKLAVIAVRRFLAWCLRKKHMTAEQFDGLLDALKTPKVHDAVQRTVWPEEFQALMAECQHPAEVGLTPVQAAAVCVRNAAIISLLYDSLIRASELCKLQVSDLLLDQGMVIVQSKGGEREWACFGAETAEHLRAWLAVRSSQPEVETLFVSIWGNTPGHPLTVRGLRIILKKLGERAGVKEISPHAFRRGGTCRLVEQGAHPRIVRDLGRWQSEDMVEKYTRGLEARKHFSRYSPVHSLTPGAENDPEKGRQG